MSIDALLPVTFQDAASLKFYTVFNGLTISPNIYFASSLYKQPITGTDAITGYDCVTDIQSFFDTFAVLEIQNINEDTLIVSDSTTSIAIPSSFPTAISMTWATGKDFDIGDDVMISSTATPSTYMRGEVTGYTSGTGAANISITSKVGSGTIADWKVSAIPKQLGVSTVASTLSDIPDAKDLLLEQHYRVSAVGAGSFKPQIWLTVSRPGAATRSDVEEVLISFVTMFPSNLATILDYAAGANFLTFFDWKTDGYLSQGYGDYRLVLLIIADGSGLKYRFKADNLANGQGVVPSVGSASTIFWTNTDTYGNVELGVPIQFDIYVKRPVKQQPRSSTTVATATGPRYELDTTTGISAAFRTNMNTGVSTLIHKQEGGQQMGNENLPFGRLFHGLYCVGSDGVDPIADLRLTKFMVYDGIPANRRFLFDL